MTKEDKQQLGQDAESVLDFQDAKEMTIGQANRKAEEIEAGVKETDNVLDKYIKQHREEIEADKFDTLIMKQPLATEEITGSTDAPVEETPVAVETEDLGDKADSRSPSPRTSS